MGYARQVALALVERGRVSEAEANAIVCRNAKIVITGRILDDPPEDVAHDIFMFNSGDQAAAEEAG
jgi:hypothetical protein